MKRLSNDAAAIDNMGVANKEEKAEQVPPKKSVIARNNWSVSNDANEEDDEPTDTEVIADSVEESSDGDEESIIHNEFVDDEAEEIENYISGDSMDEDERQEIEGIILLQFGF